MCALLKAEPIVVTEDSTGLIPQTIIFRAYNDGVAFRYELPDSRQINEDAYRYEVSAISLKSEQPTLWFLLSSTLVSDAVDVNSWSAANEGQKEVNKNTRYSFKPRSLKTPVTLKLSDKAYISVHEAALAHSGASGIHLEGNTLTYVSDNTVVEGSVTPWRTITIASHPGGLIESTLIVNLNEPSKIEDTSWIKPGKTMWDWRNHGAHADDGFEYGLTTESYIRYVDFAAENNVQYVLVDAEWYGPERNPKSDPKTPHLDALAAEGMVFENAFMYPTCSPSRAALLTGKQSFRTGCYTVPVLERGESNDNIFSKWTVGLEHPAYAEPLKEAGYKLIHLGKWHIVGPDPQAETALPLQRKLSQPPNGDLSWLASHRSEEMQKYYPVGRGFDENVGGTWWGDPARGYDEGYAAPSGGYVAPFKNPFIEANESDEWLTDRLTDEAIDFMKRHENEPFFVNLHFYAPHRPTVARDEAALRHFMEKPADSVTGQGEGDRKAIAAYATMVQSIDDNVKRIVDYLDANGLRENTVTIFTSDNGSNGLQSRNQRLRGAKGNVYDGDLRVPAFANWPPQIVPRRSEVPIHGLDFFPTFLDLAGISDYRGTLDGDSLLSLFSGGSIRERPLFWHIASTYKDPPCSIIRKGDWKLIQFFKDGRIELYNTEDDLEERRDSVLEHPEMAQALLRELTAWRKANKVPLPPSSILEL